jgi:hypothetical protein
MEAIADSLSQQTFAVAANHHLSNYFENVNEVTVGSS